MVESRSNVPSPQHGDVLPLKIVTYSTVSISLFLLLVTLILLCLLRRLRSNLHAIHRNLVAALFFSELVFLLGINQTDNMVGMEKCTSTRDTLDTKINRFLLNNGK